MSFLLTIAMWSGLALAQNEVESFARIDPYTKDAPRAKERAGYVSFGPFRFGDDHTTEQVAATLGGIPLIWVETAHFKLGSGLPEYVASDDAREKERLRDELERLAERLPDVKPRVRKLDPWLRLHLFAQRLEELYARFLAEFDVAESDFPAAPPDPATARGPYMGEGRYLGMGAKYTVLLFEKKSALGRYSARYLGQSLGAPTRWNFPITGSLLFMTAAEFLEGGYQNDSALHCDVITGVVQNLALGFRGAHVGLPFAVTEGIAHWFSREVDPRFHFFSGLDLAQIRVRDEWNWAPTVRARAEHGFFPSTHAMLGWTRAEALEWADHLILWSRMDYLLAREDGAAGSLLRSLKEPLAAGAAPLEGESLAERARQAYATLAGGDLARFDEQWTKWVLETYAKK